MHTGVYLGVHGSEHVHDVIQVCDWVGMSTQTRWHVGVWIWV